MKKNLFSFISHFVFYSSNTPKKRVNKALDLSIEGDYSDKDLNFLLHDDLFCLDPYVQRYIDNYGAEAYPQALKEAEVFFDIPNLIHSYKFIKSVDHKPINIIKVIPFKSEYLILTEKQKEWYEKEKKGIIDNSKQIIIYTDQENVPAVSLYYILKKEGKKHQFKFDLVKLDGEWKIYCCMPETMLNL